MPVSPEPSCETCGAHPGAWCRLTVGDCPAGASPPPTSEAARGPDDRLVIVHDDVPVRVAMLLGDAGGRERGDCDVDAAHARGLLALMEAGWSLERVGMHVTGLDVDRALAHVGAFPDRPVFYGGWPVRGHA